MIDLTEKYNSRELGLGIIGNGRMKDVDTYLVHQPLLQKAACMLHGRGDCRTHIAAMLGGHILMRLLDKHFGVE